MGRIRSRITLRRAAAVVALLGVGWALGLLLFLDRYLSFQQLSTGWRLAAFMLIAAGIALVAGAAAIFLCLIAKCLMETKRAAMDLRERLVVTEQAVADLRHHIEDQALKESDKNRLQLAEVALSLAQSVASLGDLVQREFGKLERQPPHPPE